MKNTIKFFGVIAIVAVIGFSMAACEDENPGDEVITLPKTFSGELTVDFTTNYYQQVIFSLLSFDTLTTISPVASAGSVTVTTNLPYPNDSFTLTANSANEYLGEKVITGLTDGQKITFTVTTSTGGLDYYWEENGEMVSIWLSLDGKALKEYIHYSDVKK